MDALDILLLNIFQRDKSHSRSKCCLDNSLRIVLAAEESIETEQQSAEDHEVEQWLSK